MRKPVLALLRPALDRVQASASARLWGLVTPWMEAHPAAGLALCELAGREVLGRLSKTPADSRLAEVSLPRATIRPGQIRRHIYGDEMRAELMRRLKRRQGSAAIQQLVDWEDAGPLTAARDAGRPVVVAAWHAGPYWAICPGLTALGIDHLAAVEADTSGPDRPAHVRVVASGAQRVAFFKEAIDAARSKRVVVIAADGPRASAPFLIEVFGRQVPIGRGAAAIARLTGASVIPVLGRWSARGQRISLRSFEAIDPPEAQLEPLEFDRRLMTAICRWFEDYLRSRPELQLLNCHVA